MDPLTVMPPELVHIVVGQLSHEDLFALSRVSRGWRRVARDPAFWRQAELCVPGTPPGLLLAAPCIGHLNVELKTASERHITALLYGGAKVHRLTCHGKQADGTKLKKLLWHCTQQQTLSELNISCEIICSQIIKAQLLKSIIRLRLSKLTLHEILVDVADELPPTGTGRQPRLRQLSVPSSISSKCFAQSIVSVIRANKTSLRALQLHKVQILYDEIVSSVFECRGLTSLAINFRLGSATATKRILEELPESITEIKELKLELPCLMDEDEDMDKLAASLVRLHALESLELVVMCSRPREREARVEGTEAKFRSAFVGKAKAPRVPATAVRVSCSRSGISCPCAPPPAIYMQPLFFFGGLLDIDDAFLEQDEEYDEEYGEDGDSGDSFFFSSSGISGEEEEEEEEEGEGGEEQEGGDSEVIVVEDDSGSEPECLQPPEA